MNALTLDICPGSSCPLSGSWVMEGLLFRRSVTPKHKGAQHQLQPTAESLRNHAISVVHHNCNSSRRTKNSGIFSMMIISPMASHRTLNKKQNDGSTQTSPRWCCVGDSPLQWGGRIWGRLWQEWPLSPCYGQPPAHFHPPTWDRQRERERGEERMSFSP